LTGVAAAAYTTKKGLPTNVPVLTGIYPRTAAPGEEILIRGKNLTSPAAERTSLPPDYNPTQVRVLFGGGYETIVSLSDSQPAATNEIRPTVPAAAQPGQAPVMVIRADDIATEELPFEVIPPEGGSS
jgi:hypothetical protein